MIDIVEPTLRTESTDQALIPRHGRDGRPKIFPEDGGKGEWYTRTTTFIDCLEDKSALSAWKLRNLLEGIKRKPAILAEYELIEDPASAEGKREVEKLVSWALDVAGTGVKASVGTALHEITEKIDHGQDPGFIPPEYEETVDAYVLGMAQLREKFGLMVVETEQFAVQDEFKVAGTFDKLLLSERTGQCYIGDTKTGGVTYGLGKIARQLAGYSRMEKYDPKTYTRTPIQWEGQTVNQDTGFILHLPSGEGVFDAFPVDLTAGWEGFLACAMVREDRKFWGRKAARQDSIVQVGLES